MNQLEGDELGSSVIPMLKSITICKNAGVGVYFTANEVSGMLFITHTNTTFLSPSTHPVLQVRGKRVLRGPSGTEAGH